MSYCLFQSFITCEFSCFFSLLTLHPLIVLILFAKLCFIFLFLSPLFCPFVFLASLCGSRLAFACCGCRGGGWQFFLLFLCVLLLLWVFLLLMWRFHLGCFFWFKLWTVFLLFTFHSVFCLGLAGIHGCVLFLNGPVRIGPIQSGAFSVK